MVEEEVEESLIEEANISLVIKNYNDIFSSFDARPYSEKALSVDFLDECKRAARDKENGVELRILVPKSIRNTREEWKIKRRLKEHFAHHLEIKEHEIRGIKREGLLWAIFGMVLLATILVSLIKLENTFWGSLIVLFEVPGWFLIWEGMAKIIFTAREKFPEYDFYKKMSEAEINFTDF